MVNYNIDDDSGNDNEQNSNTSDNDGRDAKNFKITSYAAIDGVLDGVFSTSSDWGQSVAMVMTDVDVVDGALYDRGDGTYKLFSWQALGLGEDDLDEDEELTVDMAPRRYSESFGQNNYSYKLVDARIDESSDAGEPIPVGEIIMFEGATEYGPSASAKTIARTLTEAGRDAVVDEDDQYEWLASDVSLRDDLDGVEVRYFKVQRPGEEYDFDLPVFTHLGLNERITIDRGNSSPSESESVEDGSEDTDNTNDTEEVDDTANSESDGFEPAVSEFISTVTEMQISNEGAILRMLDSMTASDDVDLSEGMVEEQKDEIVAAIQA